MRLRWIGAMLAGGVLAGAPTAWLASDRVLPPGPEYSDVAVALRVPQIGDVSPVDLASSEPPPELPRPVVLPAPPAADTALVTPMPPRLAPWTAVLGPGDTLDGMLRRAGLPADLRLVFTRRCRPSTIWHAFAQAMRWRCKAIRTAAPIRWFFQSPAASGCWSGSKRSR